MIVLERRSGQEVYIGDVCVSVVAIEAHRVSLGIHALSDTTKECLEVRLAYQQERLPWFWEKSGPTNKRDTDRA